MSQNNANPSSENNAKAPAPGARDRFSFGLVHQAGKGTFSTRRVAQKAAGEDETLSTEERTADAGTQVAQALKPEALNAEPEVEPEVEPEALNSDRIKQGDGGIFDQSKAKKELLITASAAKSLTQLMAAITVNPGSGNEVPASVRSKILHQLVEKSHVVADALCKAIMTDGQRAPDFLRARFLQQCAAFVSDQWIKGHDIDATSEQLIEMARASFGGEVPGLTQEVVDLFHIAQEYTPATKQEISQSKITETVVTQTWKMFLAVNEFNVNDYDDESGDRDAKRAFSFGQKPEDVARDLVSLALSIAKENELDVMDLDLATSWQQNSIRRACSLVESEYKMIVDRTLRSAFQEDLHSEAQLGYANSLYDDVLGKVKSRARTSFIVVEKNAIDAMSGNSYVHYLPKKHESQEVLGSLEQVPANNKLSDPEAQAEANNSPSHTKERRFSFGARHG